MFLQEFGMNNNTYWLQRIEKINIGQYNISLISAENKIINAIAVIKYDKEHPLINFVPDVIGKLVMRENLFGTYARWEDSICYKKWQNRTNPIASCYAGWS